MHANPVTFQNLAALCTILIDTVQRLNHCLCHPLVCFLQVRISVCVGYVVKMLLYMSLLPYFQLVPQSALSPMQFQGALCCLILACGWIWAGCLRLKEVRRLQVTRMQKISRKLTARHGASASPPITATQSSPIDTNKVKPYFMYKFVFLNHGAMRLLCKALIAQFEIPHTFTSLSLAAFDP